jgi:spore coat protein CotH
LIATKIAIEQQDGYEDLIDLDNWIDYFIIQEFVKNVDVGWSSVYMYKEPQGKLKFGPVWDFDLAYGNADYIDYGPENWYGMREYKNHFLPFTDGNSSCSTSI